MPSTVIRSAQKAGLVLIESRVSVANDGLVTIDASFLAPTSGVALNTFDLDASWPSIFALPPATPTLQGGPYLLSKNVSKKNGLTIVQAQYVSATNPVRVAISESTEKLTFSGYAEQTQNNTTTSGSLSFDYYASTQTATYTLIAPTVYSPTVSGRIGAKFNFRREGEDRLITLAETETLVSSDETLGKVSRISVTARRIIEQGDVPPANILPFMGRTLAGPPLNVSWVGRNR